MYLIKDIDGNYFNAGQVNYLEVQNDSDGRYIVAAVDIERNEFHVSQHGTEEEARKHLDVLVYTIMRETNINKIMTRIIEAMRFR